MSVAFFIRWYLEIEGTAYGEIKSFLYRYIPSDICVRKAWLVLKLFFSRNFIKTSLVLGALASHLMSFEREHWITRKQLLTYLDINEHALRSCLPPLSELVHYRRKNPLGSNSKSYSN